MTTYGMLPTGFLAKPATVCAAEIGAAIQLRRGPSVDISDFSLEGQIAKILGEREGDIWAALQALYAQFDVDQATDAGQDAITAITGTFRQAARSSIDTITLTGTNGTVVPINSQVKTASTGSIFYLSAAATIVTVTAWVTATVYAVGDRRTSSGNVYQCITAGTSAAAPTTTAADITDGTAHWAYLGAGTAAVDVLALSLVKDAIVAVARDLTVINTPIGGWTGVINLADAVVGQPVQTNASLRLTRELELSQQGSSTADAIRAALLNITGVTSATVFHNESDVADANGLSPHSVQALVIGGSDTAVATVLMANVGAGIQTLGTTSVSLTDSTGATQVYKFSRVTSVPIYIDITLTYNSAPSTKGGYPVTGDALVATAIANFAATVQVPGKDVVASSISAAVFPLFVNNAQVAGVQGVLDVSLVKIGVAPSPSSSTTIVLGPFQQALISIANITVHSSAGNV